MQTGSEQLKNQQRLMQAESFYNGKIDGIWGPKTIAAKVKWERSGRYAPAIPNNGFPLSDRGPLPRGVFRKPDGSLSSTKMDQQPVSLNTAERVAVQPEPEAPAVEVAKDSVEVAKNSVEVAKDSAKQPTQPQSFNKHNHTNQKR